MRQLAPKAKNLFMVRHKHSYLSMDFENAIVQQAKAIDYLWNNLLLQRKV